MSVTMSPYLNFRGQAAPAMALYQSVLGGALTQTTFGEAGMGAPEDATGVMHAQLVTPNGMTLMGADTPSHMEHTADGSHAVSLSGGPEDADDLRTWFTGLSAGGTVSVPLAPAPWGDTFGMFTDRFGINWMVNISAA